MNFRIIVFSGIFALFFQSCEKKLESALPERVDSSKANDSTLGSNASVSTDATPTACIKSNALIAYLPCPIAELALDGNLDNKKQDCLDSIDQARNTSVLRSFPNSKPFFLPRLLEIEDLFPQVFYIAAMASGDSQIIRKSIGSTSVELIGDSETWHLRTRNWMDSLGASAVLNDFNKIPSISSATIHRANGVLAVGICLSASDSSSIYIASTKEGIPLKFKRISYPFPDLEDLSVTENDEE